MAVMTFDFMTGTNRNRRRPETESAEEAERHTRGRGEIRFSASTRATLEYLHTWFNRCDGRP